MWELDYKESWALENWYFWTVVLEKTESPFDSKEIKPVNHKENESWILMGRTDAETEAPVFWSLDVNSQLIRKVCDAGKDWGLEEKRTSENEMTGWHHRCSGYELGQTLGDSEGQGCLACCSPWGCKEFSTTERLNNRPPSQENISRLFKRSNILVLFHALV